MVSAKKILLLDLDGTLVDSYHIHYQTWSIALRADGIPLDKNTFDTMSGSDSYTAAKYFDKAGTEAKWRRMIKKKEAEFAKRISSIRLLDGANELIELAKNLDCKIGLVTSASHDDLVRILSLVKLSDSFDIIISIEDAKAPKPNPDLLFRAITSLQCLPDQALYVGDAVIDIIMAQEAHVTSIGMSNDSTKLLAFLNAGANRIARDLFEVTALFKSWVRSPESYSNKSVFSNKIVFLQSQMNPVWEHGRPPMKDPVDGHHWVIQNSTRPVSISRVEAYFLYNVVRLMKSKIVFEIGTGFGYSSWWLAAGMMEREDGWVGSLDNHSEGERRQDLLHFAKQGAKHLGFDKIIDYFIGESPKDVSGCVGKRRIDLAFIDGYHHDLQPLLDYETIDPATTNSSCLIFHDVNSRYTVENAITQASNNGWYPRKFLTSCQIVACVRDKNVMNVVEEAFVYAKRLEFAD